MTTQSRANKKDRESWILQYLAKAGDLASVDVLDSAFVDAYAIATGATVQAMAIGANRCPQLGRDLSKIAERGLLTRARVSITGMGAGWPKWVWSYSISESGRMQAEMDEAIRETEAVLKAA